MTKITDSGPYPLVFVDNSPWRPAPLYSVIFEPDGPAYWPIDGELVEMPGYITEHSIGKSHLVFEVPAKPQQARKLSRQWKNWPIRPWNSASGGSQK